MMNQNRCCFHDRRRQPILSSKMMLSLSLLSISSLIGSTTAWTSSNSLTTRRRYSPSIQSTSTSCLYNVPPPSSDDVVAYKEYASKQSPPSSFFELQQDCLMSVKQALADKLLLMEVEFPPLPAAVLDLDDVSAYDVATANLQLATDFAKMVVNSRSKINERLIEKVAILLPDETEAKIAIERSTGNKNIKSSTTTEIAPGVVVSSLRRSEEGDTRFIKVRPKNKNKTCRLTFFSCWHEILIFYLVYFYCIIL